MDLEAIGDLLEFLVPIIVFGLFLIIVLGSFLA